MGAIERNGYIFEVEFSQIEKRGALHVTQNGQFVRELTFEFEGEQPDQEKIEDKIDEFFENLALN